MSEKLTLTEIAGILEARQETLNVNCAAPGRVLDVKFARDLVCDLLAQELAEECEGCTYWRGRSAVGDLENFDLRRKLEQLDECDACGREFLLRELTPQGTSGAAQLCPECAAEEEYPPSREASAITALQALREAVRRAEEQFATFSKCCPIGGGNERCHEDDLISLREETRGLMGEGSS